MSSILRGHLARVAGVHAVVARRGGEEHLRVLPVLRHVLVRRVLRDEGPVLGIVGVAVLAHPRGARRAACCSASCRAAAPWHTTAPKSSGRCSKAAPTSSPPWLPPRMPRCRGEVTLRAIEVLGHRGVVVVRLLAVFLARREVPGRAELAAAAQVGEHPHAALRQPRRADGAAVVGHHRDCSKPP